MYEQIINKYYNNLEYDLITKEKAITLINNLSIQIKNKDIKNLSERFFETAETIETHLFWFVPICKHIDIVTAIIEYLHNYGAQFMFNPEFDNAEYEYKEHYIPISLMLTVFSMCREEAIILFLHHAIIDDSVLIMSEIFFYYVKLMINESNQNNEMILLEDSDLYAVINCLMIVDNSCLNKIWIQQSIRQKFLKLTKKYLNHFKCPIQILRSQQELFTFNIPRKSIMNTISIWSENIVTAKNLASCLDGDIIFINTHMDFNGGVLFVPFAPLIDNLIDRIIMNTIDKTNLHLLDITPPNNAIKMNEEHLTSNPVIYNLFYDGIWQKPVKGIYWKHNDKIFASATNDDIRRCVQSAEEGFKIWRTYTIASRIEVLSKLTETLMYYREFLLSSLVSKCIQLSYLLENITGCCSGDEKIELIITWKPKGIIILKEENQNTLFSRLIQSLLAGNSVIVIFNANFCNLSRYFNTFSISGIPPGVINMLSSENIIDLESRLCGTQYSIYTKRFFSEGNLIKKYTKLHVQLSVPKQIIHPLK